jgi:hypothetical protein
MRTVRRAAVILAMLGAMCALLDYASVFRESGGAHAAMGYAWLLVTAVLATVAVLSHTREGPDSDKRCQSCKKHAHEDWIACPHCGARLSEEVDATADAWNLEPVAGWRAFEVEKPDESTVGKTLFWLGIIGLDVLLVLLTLWLFIPRFILAQRFFYGLGGTLGLVVLDVAIGCILIGYSYLSSPIRV